MQMINRFRFSDATQVFCKELLIICECKSNNFSSERNSTREHWRQSGTDQKSKRCFEILATVNTSTANYTLQITFSFSAWASILPSMFYAKRTIAGVSCFTQNLPIWMCVLVKVPYHTNHPLDIYKGTSFLGKLVFSKPLNNPTTSNLQ